MMASKPCLATSAAAYFLARGRGQISTMPTDRRRSDRTDRRHEKQPHQHLGIRVFVAGAKWRPVSMPIAWEELDARFDPAAFTLTSSRRHARGDRDSWAGYWTMRQRLPGP